MFFWETNNIAFIELGNYYIRSSLVEKKFNKCKVVNQLTLTNSSYKNGVIRNKDSFAESIVHILEQYKHNFNSIVIGLNSSYLSYDSFEVNGKCKLEYIADMMPDNKVIHHWYEGNKISTLSVNRFLLAKLYANLEPLSSKPVRFMAMDYLKCLDLNKEKMTLVVNMGYRSTSLSLFEDNFLSFYKAVPLGGESLAIAVAKRYGISVLESIELIKKIDLEKRDGRSWIDCGSLKLNSAQVTEVIDFYLEALLNKLLQGIKYGTGATQNILIGWISIIKGSKNVLQKYLTPVVIHQEDQLAKHSDFKEHLYRN